MEIEYKDSLVTYVDLIGSSDLIESSEKNPSLIKTILDRLKLFRESVGIGNLFHTTDSSAGYSFMSFSDLVVRTVPLVNGVSLVDALSRELFYLAVRQFELAKDGVWIRGGMCRKPIYINGEFVFGPGLVKAYLLERDWAIFPRIIVDRKLQEILQSNEAPFDWNDILRQGDEGAYFIDYLLWVASNGNAMYHKDDGDSLVLNIHRKRIENELATIEERNPRIKQKIMWLCLYHNSTIDRLIAFYKGKTAARSRLEPLKFPPEKLRF
jgi:hypothetical protein